MKQIKTSRNGKLPKEGVKEVKEKPKVEKKVAVKVAPAPLAAVNNQMNALLVGAISFFFMMLVFNVMIVDGLRADINKLAKSIELTSMGVNNMKVVQDVYTLNAVHALTAASNQSSFCYGYDASGKIGFAIDDRKTPACAGVNVSRSTTHD